jgi:hypothetical protein
MVLLVAASLVHQLIGNRVGSDRRSIMKFVWQGIAWSIPTDLIAGRILTSSWLLGAGVSLFANIVYLLKVYGWMDLRDAVLKARKE